MWDVDPVNPTLVRLTADAYTTLQTNDFLNAKANTVDVTTSLASKANTADVTASLATKANTTDITTLLATKAPKDSPTFTGTATFNNSQNQETLSIDRAKKVWIRDSADIKWNLNVSDGATTLRNTSINGNLGVTGTLIVNGASTLPGYAKTTDLATKANSIDVYTKTESNDLISTKSTPKFHRNSDDT